MNELIFFAYTFLLSFFALVALKISKEALIAYITLLVILSNLLVTKTITLFGLTATASDALAVGATLSLNLLQQYFGKILARRAIWISFFCMVIYIIITYLHLLYTPAIGDHSQVHFAYLFDSAPRIVLASLLVYLIVQNLDCWIYGCLIDVYQNRFFILRNYTSAMITQFVDTVLFSFLGLYKLNEQFDSLNVIFNIILISYLIKLLVIIFSTPFLTFSKKLILDEPQI